MNHHLFHFHLLTGILNFRKKNAGSTPQWNRQKKIHSGLFLKLFFLKSRWASDQCVPPKMILSPPKKVILTPVIKQENQKSPKWTHTKLKWYVDIAQRLTA
jgi:hypothetical protein